RAVAVVEDVGRQHLERMLRDGGTGRDRGGAGEVVDQYVQAGDRVYATGGDDAVGGRVAFAALETSSVGHAPSIAPRGAGPGGDPSGSRGAVSAAVAAPPGPCRRCVRRRPWGAVPRWYARSVWNLPAKASSQPWDA